jgi:nucleoside-diphosphate-sugar epimerase
VIDRLPEGNSADDVLDPDERASVTFVADAIPRTRPLARLLREHRVDAVVHLASPLATVTESHPREAVDSMIVPHMSILDAARLAGARKVVWASSVGVFGRTQDYERLPIPNDAPHRPLTIYGAAKAFMEALSDRFTQHYGLDTIGLRFPLVYGPGRRRGGGQFTTRLIEGAALGVPCVVEDADSRNDWMFVTDAARSVELALRSPRTPSRALTVGGEVGTTREVVAMLRALFPTAEIDERPGESASVSAFDPEPARTEIGYAPAVGLREGILATVNAARDRVGLPEVR